MGISRVLVNRKWGFGKDKKNGPPSHVIPNDILFEIFSRLPAKSIMRFRCASKFSDSLVSQPDFVHVHQCRSMTRRGGTKLIVHGDKNVYSVDQNDQALVHIAEFEQLYDRFIWGNKLEFANGLFCCWSRSLNSLPVVICNPATRQVKLIPCIDVTSYYFQYALGFEPEQKTYKVLFMSWEFSENYPRSRVFSLGTDEAWREIESAPLHYWYQCKEGVSIDGVVYMLNRLELGNIVAFDVKSESFRTIPLWGALHRIGEDDYNLVEIEGNLAVLESKMVNGEIHFWILGKGLLEGWERHIILGFPSPDNDVLFSCQTYFDGEIIMVAGVNCVTRSYFCYDITRESWRECEVGGFRGYDSIRGIYKCVETVFPVGKKNEAALINKMEQMLSYLWILSCFVSCLPVLYWALSKMYQGRSGYLLLVPCLYAFWFFCGAKLLLKK